MRTNSSLPNGLKTTDVINKLPALMAVFGLLTIFAVPAFAGGPPEREGAWGNDQVYVMMIPKIPVPAAGPAQEELYVIAPVYLNNPQSPGHGTIIGPHDHVIPIPPHNGGEFSAIWHAVLILPGPNATSTNVLVRTVNPPNIELVYAADLGTGLVNLTSVEKIEQAVKLGLVTEVPIPVVFVCPIVKVGQPT